MSVPRKSWPTFGFINKPNNSNNNKDFFVIVMLSYNRFTLCQCVTNVHRNKQLTGFATVVLFPFAFTIRQGLFYFSANQVTCWRGKSVKNKPREEKCLTRKHLLLPLRFFSHKHHHLPLGSCTTEGQITSSSPDLKPSLFMYILCMVCLLAYCLCTDYNPSKHCSAVKMNTQWQPFWLSELHTKSMLLSHGAPQHLLPTEERDHVSFKLSLCTK